MFSLRSVCFGHDVVHHAPHVFAKIAFCGAAPTLRVAFICFSFLHSRFVSLSLVSFSVFLFHFFPSLSLSLLSLSSTNAMTRSGRSCSPNS